VSELGAGGVAVVSPVAGTVASDPAAPSLLAGPSVAVDVPDDVAHVPDVVVGVAVSTPSVVLPDGATPSAAGVQEMSVAAVDVSVTAAVLSAVVVVVSGDVAHVPDVVGAVAVSAPSVVLPDGGMASAAAVQEVSVTAVDASATASVLSAVVVVSVEDDDESVDEIELALSVVTPESVSEAPAVVSDVCALPVTSAVVVVLASAEEAVVSAEGIAVSSVASGGTGTSSALADATQVDVEATPTIKTAVQRISRSSRRRRQNVRSHAATLRVPSFIGSLLAPTASRQVASIAVTRRETKAATRFPSETCRLPSSLRLDEPQVEVYAPPISCVASGGSLPAFGPWSRSKKASHDAFGFADLQLAVELERAWELSQVAGVGDPHAPSRVGSYARLMSAAMTVDLAFAWITRTWALGPTPYAGATR
jgi:hypothetical protein